MLLLDNQLQHYVVCYLYEKQKGFLIGDPAKGVYILSVDELDKIWVSKTCLTLDINESFVTAETAKNLQKKWFLNLLKEDYQTALYFGFTRCLCGYFRFSHVIVFSKTHR